MIEFKTESNNCECTYTYDDSCISFSAYKDKLIIWFYPNGNNGYDMLSQINEPQLFSDFAEKVVNWLVYQAMTDNIKWNDSGILNFDNDPIIFAEGNWSLVFSDFRLPSIEFSDTSSKLTFQIDYNTLPMFLEWASKLRNFI